VVEDLAAQERPSRLKERTLDPARGKDDPRLVAFATTLARTRFLVLVPGLPNLRALRVQAEDALGVVDAFSHLLSRSEFPTRGRAGIGAFSYAVGPAVLAALEPGIRERVDFVLDRRAMWRAIHSLLAQRNNPGEGR